MTVEIYGKNHCSACKKAELICEQNQISFNSLKIENGDYDIVTLFEKVGENIRSFPQIFVDLGQFAGGNKHIGGLKEFEELINGQSI